MTQTPRRALITGASGFIGAHILRAALRDGIETRALVRPHSDRANLRGLPVEIVEGDLTDPDSFRRALAGVDTLFHAAARYDLSRRAAPEIRAANVDGARALMQAALRAQIDRIVFTSSVAAVGPPRRGARPADESQFAPEAHAPGPYEASKIASERIVRDLVRDEALPAVIVLPTAPIGPLDRKPTPTGRLIADAAHGRMPAYISRAGLNIAPVADVAQGHILAARHGQIGQRYILGHQDGNLTLAQIIQRAARAGGVKPPRFPIPWQLAYAAALIEERLSDNPRATIAGVRLARHRQWFDCRKAIDCLHLPQSPLDHAFQEAADWFQSRGESQGR